MNPDERELLCGVESEPSSDKRLPIFFYWLFGFFLLLLSLSYFLGGGQLLTYVQNSVESASFEAYEAKYNQWRVVFSPGQYARLQQVYLVEQQLEFSACLQGTFQNNTYMISDFFLPLMTHQSFANVLFQACPKETLILFHTHPRLHCLFSETDVKTYHEAKKRNTDVLMMVMCDKNRFSFYREEIFP